MQIRLQTCLIERIGSYNAKLLCRLVDRYVAAYTYTLRLLEARCTKEVPTSKNCVR